MPLASSFPKDAWRDEVRRGYDFYFASGRTDLPVPVFADTHHYFASRAPNRLELPEPAPVDISWSERFRRHDILIPGVKDAAISFVDCIDAGDPLGRGIIFSDMRAGGVYFAGVKDDGTLNSTIEIGRVRNPAAVRVSDWDDDGRMDFLVADLGSFLPADHQDGRVIWFQQRADAPGRFQVRTLHDQVGRVAAIEVADFDRDGIDDLLVSEFGWHETGSIFWLQRTSTGDALLKHTVDTRPGTIHVPVADLNDDGALDFVALISQEYERVEAMINDGRGNFRSELIHAAPDPSYGSSGIELADMNDDGRVDVIYSNGDSFDSFLLKPFHGVQWLENRGTYPFAHHDVGPLPGAHRAVHGDLDDDGRPEIVAGAFVPRDLFVPEQYERAESLVLWTQTGSQGFSKHVLSRGDCVHAALTVADVNGDGKDDLIVGKFRESGKADGPAVTVWSQR